MDNNVSLHSSSIDFLAWWKLIDDCNASEWWRLTFFFCFFVYKPHHRHHHHYHPVLNPVSMCPVCPVNDWRSVLKSIPVKAETEIRRMFILIRLYFFYWFSHKFLEYLQASIIFRQFFRQHSHPQQKKKYGFHEAIQHPATAQQQKKTLAQTRTFQSETS